MPDAHLGIGATVGSVIPTNGAVIPAAVGVDIGCGMIAVETDLAAGDLPDTLGPVLTDLEDTDLAWLSEGTDEFDHYIADMLWAQDYAAANRDQMMDAALRVLFARVGRGRERHRVNCHHNFTQREIHGGMPVWLTRKGAIKAGVGELGVIPGSMGAATYVVEGLVAGKLRPPEPSRRPTVSTTVQSAGATPGRW